MSIQVLPPEIANQIAAGEVVERPASVVKECVENSLDAGAKNIEIHISDGGKELIKIIDDGKGMSPEDAKKCHLRHATSKISKIDDLFTVQSFGFRGEALAAISAVSDFTLITKRAEDETGTKIQIFAGKNITESPAPANTGTTIEIRKLFYPTPARLAHLKTNATEIREISREIQAFALANPQVSFKFFKDDKLALDLPATDKKTRVAEILKENPDDLAEVFFKSREISISGFLIKPGKCVSNKKSQFLFVNGRRIEDYKLAYAIREAYVQSAGIEHHLHPKFAIFIEIDPILVDVNVHPRKLEVKFAEAGDVFRAVKQACVSALEKVHTTPFSGFVGTGRDLSAQNSQNFAGFQPSPQTLSPREREFSSNGRKNYQSFGINNNAHKIPRNYPKMSKSGLNTYSNTSSPDLKTFSTQNFERNLQNTGNFPLPEEKNIVPTGELKLIGQISRKYIMAEAENGIWIFDQHALHERQRFEEFWKSREKLTKEIQKLLVPYVLKIEDEDWETIWQNRSELQKLGFEFSENKEVLAVPKILVKENLDQIFAGFSQYFSENKVGETPVDRFLRKILEYKSCRGAVMFGDKMEPAEMQKLLDDFQTTQWRNLCPHGRPNHIFWSFDDLDREFHR